jgi:hypothetical protein
MGRRSLPVALALSLSLSALLAAGCGETDGERAVRAVREFVGALERADGRPACERLAEAGVSELLLAALRTGIPASGLESPGADRCAIVARRLAEGASGLAELRRSPVTRTLVEGDRATVETRTGAYELEEGRDGHWRVARFEPVVRVLTGGSASERPVGLAVVRPRLREPALGPALAGRTDEESIELTGTLEPEGARLGVEPSPGTRAARVDASDGRFRVRLRLRPGRNEVVLVARAPGRATNELAVRLTRE